MEQTHTARVVLLGSMGPVVRRGLAGKTVRQLDQERQVSEELRFRDIPMPVHVGPRAQRPGPILAGRALRQGRQPGMSVQQRRGALCDDRRAEHGRLRATVLLRQKQLSDVVVRPTVGLPAAAVAQFRIFTVDGSQ